MPRRYSIGIVHRNGATLLRQAPAALRAARRNWPDRYRPFGRGPTA